MFVSHIVTYEYRGPATKRHLSHEGANRKTLVTARRRQLDYSLSPVQTITVSERNPHRPHFAVGETCQVRCTPIMQREGQSLVLEHQPRMALNYGAQYASGWIERAR
jgi:hypothetical protein